MDTYPPLACKALGEALQQRRGQLGHHVRKAFSGAAGGLLSDKTLQRLELGKQAGYPVATIAAAETMYQLAPGSIKAKLNGGELTPLPGTPGGRPLPAEDGLSDDDREMLRLFREVLDRRRSDPARHA